MKEKGRFIVLVYAVLLVALSSRFIYAQNDSTLLQNDSGGILLPEQAAYDVKSYDLDLRLDIKDKSIAGVLIGKH